MVVLNLKSEISSVALTARLGYTRFWPSILYQYYTDLNYYYTIQYIYQYYTNFIGGFVHRCVYSSKKTKLKNSAKRETRPLKGIFISPIYFHVGANPKIIKYLENFLLLNMQKHISTHIWILLIWWQKSLWACDRQWHV